MGSYWLDFYRYRLGATPGSRPEPPAVSNTNRDEVKGLSQRAADFGTDHERAFRVLYVIFRIIEDGI